MTSTYLELIDDHGEIDKAAAALLALARGRSDPALLSEMLYDLGSRVRDHVSAENSAIGTAGVGVLTATWQSTWQKGQGAFESLCQDWFEYLREWTTDAIAADPESFAVESEAILARLDQRLRFESEALYASALQSGAIRLRRSN